MQNNSRRIFALVGLLLPACDLQRSEYDDLAKVVAAGLATPDGGGDLGAVADSTMLARGIVPDGFTTDGMITQGKRWGVTHRYTVMCSDELAQPLERCDWRTDRATVVALREGELAMPDFTSWLRHQGTWMITSVDAPIALANGYVAMTWQEAIFLDRTYRLTDTAELRMFVDMGRQDMMGGIVTRELEVEVEDDFGTWSLDLHAELGIESPTTASLVLDHTHTYEVELATGAVTDR